MVPKKNMLFYFWWYRILSVYNIININLNYIGTIVMYLTSKTVWLWLSLVATILSIQWCWQQEN
jgi:hypothetical protein